jgi:hypothetical protein
MLHRGDWSGSGQAADASIARSMKMTSHTHFIWNTSFLKSTVAKTIHPTWLGVAIVAIS